MRQNLTASVGASTKDGQSYLMCERCGQLAYCSGGPASCQNETEKRLPRQTGSSSHSCWLSSEGGTVSAVLVHGTRPHPPLPLRPSNRKGIFGQRTVGSDVTSVSSSSGPGSSLDPRDSPGLFLLFWERCRVYGTGWGGGCSSASHRSPLTQWCSSR